MAIDPNSVQWDDAPAAPLAIDPNSVQWDDAPQPATKRELPKVNASTLLAGLGPLSMLAAPNSRQMIKDTSAGALRGAGSIGATLLYPVDAAARAVGIENDWVGRDDRRTGMDSGLAELGANPESGLYQAGKLGGEIAGTAGAGPALAGGAKVVGASPAIVSALQTGGLNVGGMTGIPGLLTRGAAGAAVGGTAAGMVNPEDAAMGAVVGGALPAAVKVAGSAGKKVGDVWRGPTQPDDLANAVRQAQSAGYVIPPTQANASLPNRLLEGLSGKISTAQNASAKNQGITNALAAKSIGLPEDTKLTAEVLDDVRREAGKAYKQLADLPTMPAVRANSLTNTPGSPAIKPAEMVFDLRKARNDATAWYRSYAMTANPDALVKAQTAKAEASMLEGALESYAKSLGKDDLVEQMANARQLIAKTYTIEDALNSASGSVDARRLAKQLAKGKPLSGELKEAAEFAARFPKAAQAVEGMGSLPQTSPLDWTAAGAFSMATQNPLGLLSVAARPAARYATLSPLVQGRLIQSRPTGGLLSDPELLQLGYRAAPLLMGDR